MRATRLGHPLGLLAVAWLALALPMRLASAQTTAPTPNLLDQLAGLEAPAELDLSALRQQAMDRIQSKAYATPVERPPIAPQLLKLPHFDFDAAFDSDSAVLRPQSYQTIGRIADALSNPRLLPYTFLVVDHTEAKGRRADNLALSQRRADSIRAILAGAFKISSKRLQAIGLGEEQLQIPSRPASSGNARAQIVAIGNVPTVSIPPNVDSAAPTNKAPPATSKKR